ncbi:MAG: phosphodiester glycosidase family protein [Candidatus Schekmanbacteria bacterium]|nr:phosphodiester glycosidase family protein [Candidatus Schekmanbacteria bacterium]
MSGLVMILMLAAGGAAPLQAAGWIELAPGIDWRELTPTGTPAAGDAAIVAIRVDPAAWELLLLYPDQHKDAPARTARQWADAHGLAIATNAGMFATDYRTHVGYMESRGHVVSQRFNSYQSVAVFDPSRAGRVPPFRIVDLDVLGTTLESLRRDYSSILQNLRLIKRPGINKWNQQDRAWSEAALAEDAQGRILFLFSRAVLAMSDFNREILSAGIGVVAAQHLEGGAESQLFVRLGDFVMELSGSYETPFGPGDDSPPAWPIPNVLGIRRRGAAAPGR